MSTETGLDGKPITWLTTYAEVRDVFKRPELLQASHDGAKETIFADVLMTLNGALHAHRRRTEMTLLRPNIVAALENVVVPAEAARLIAAIKSGGEVGRIGGSSLGRNDAKPARSHDNVPGAPGTVWARQGRCVSA